MRKFITLAEKYSNDLLHFKNYIKDAKFDPYAQWFWVCKWLEKNRYLGDVSDLLGEPVKNAAALDEHDPGVFFKLPKDVQDECAEAVSEKVMRLDPASASAHQFLDLSDKNLLHRQTWLVHFSDNAQDISYEGFKYGVDEMDKLGLTKYLSDADKKYPGYNFAFEANSKYAMAAASGGNYGNDAVIFQSSGVKCWHNGDEESQIIFYGPNVNPNTIIYLKQDYGDWLIIPKKDIPNRDYLFKGEYKNCVAWIIKNHAQYRKLLF